MKLQSEGRISVFDSDQSRQRRSWSITTVLSSVIIAIRKPCLSLSFLEIKSHDMYFSVSNFSYSALHSQDLSIFLPVLAVHGVAIALKYTII